mmetsp:Transcript_28289/g.58768  ORF Transcript_28289/g.58768 Transcript_28289/m.58768 type:complete len:321 (+) Transcript_28289:535-1497(+)
MPPYSESQLSNWGDASSSSSSSSSTSSSSRPCKSLDEQCLPTNHGQQRTHEDLVRMAGVELESMRKLYLQSLQTSPPVSPGKSLTSSALSSSSSRSSSPIPKSHDGSRSFPPACLSLLQSLPGNLHCIDCHAADASWASVTYGTVMCLKCSGRHRGLGVQTSYVKSLTMDSWNHSQVLSMLEGGNTQLSQFFSRHHMSPTDPNYYGPDVINRYNTKAALFYKHHLSNHIKSVAEKGVYLGREACRRGKSGNKSSGKIKSVNKKTGNTTSSSPSRGSSGNTSFSGNKIDGKKTSPHAVKIPTIEENSVVETYVDSLCTVRA